MKDILKKEVDRIANVYARTENREILRLELEILVIMAEKEQIREQLNK